jgi:outer membrane protein
MKNLILALSLLMAAPAATFAQKIAFADVNAILSVMPENEKINADLQIYATGLQKRLDDMKAQLDGMAKAFESALAAKDTAKAIGIQEKAMEADKQLQQALQQAEQQLGQKRGELLQPVLERIRKAMEAVAKKGGYEYVLNSVDGSGTSIMLWGPENANVTRQVVDELGIKLEGATEDQPAPAQQAPAQNAGKKK